MKQDNPSSSSTRVKAFRERLDSQFKRVEAYVTEDEKTRIQAVRTNEKVTADVAVAGLLRLGLERYEELQAQSRLTRGVAASGSVIEAAQNGPALSERSPVFAAGAAMSAGPSFSGALSAALAPTANVANAAAPVTAPGEDPIARFFKNRKEIING